MKIFLILLQLFIASILLARNQIEPFKILPKPQKVEILSEVGIKFDELTYLISTDSFSLPVLGAITNTLIQSKPDNVSQKGVMLRLTSQNVPQSAEGYVLRVSNKGITISASTQAGLFYGCQTLEQLLEDSRDLNLIIPAMLITDYPLLEYRAVHFDTKNHLDRIDYYYYAIDKLSKYKINAVIWEIEDKLRYTRRPEVAAPNAISKQEMRALSHYAKKRNIEISPLVQGLGHAGFILKHHWELRETPQNYWEFCPADPRTYQMQFDLYLDAFDAFPHGKYLHVGGDEITNIGIDDRCKATGKTPFELQMMWLKRVCDFVVEHNRTPIFWDDMPLKFAGLWETILSDVSEEKLNKSWDTSALDEAIKLFPRECVYMRWNYEDATMPAHQRILKWYNSKGLKVMGATAASTNHDLYLPRDNSRVDYIKGFSELVAKNNLVGILTTAWDDASPHWETLWRGFIAQGEYGWNPHSRNRDELFKAHSQREFGFKPNSDLMSFLPEIEKSASFFDHALITEGYRNPAFVTGYFKLIELPNKENPGSWSAKYADKITQAKEESERFEKVIDQGLRNALAQARRNRYTLEVYQQTAFLLNYPVRVLLALNNFDIANNANERTDALEKISAICNDFDVMRSKLEGVYSRTRFMENPSGYIEDLKPSRHLAAQTNNSDWIYMYEIPMVEKIREWLYQN